MPDKHRNLTGYLASAAMELCWLHALVFFLLATIFDYSVSILFSAVLFLGGAITTRIMLLKRRLVIWVILAHAVVFSLLTEVAVRYFVYPLGGGPEPIGFMRLITSDNGILEWLLVAMLLLVTVFYYQRGMVSISRPFDEHTMYNRFDLGITAFVVLLVIEALMMTRGGIAVKSGPLEYQFIPFFLFGLLAIGVTKISAGEERHFSQRFYRIGIALGVTVIVLVSGVGMVLIFNTQMLTTAESLSGVLHKIGGPVGRGLVAILRFLWGGRRITESGAGGADSAPRNQELLVPEQKGEPGLLQEIALWVLVAIAAVVALILAVLVIRLLLRILLREHQAPVRTVKWTFDPLAWLRRFMTAVSGFLKRWFSLLKPPDSASEAYKRLERWGRRSGKPLQQSETPLEYSFRLAGRFPALEKDISQLVEMINREVYGTRALDDNQRQRIRSILRTLSHPVHWPGRLKSWLLSGSGRYRNRKPRN